MNQCINCERGREWGRKGFREWILDHDIYNSTRTTRKRKRVSPLRWGVTSSCARVSIQYEVRSLFLISSMSCDEERERREREEERKRERKSELSIRISINQSINRSVNQPINQSRKKGSIVMHIPLQNANICQVKQHPLTRHVEPEFLNICF